MRPSATAVYTTPLTDFRGGGQAPIDATAKATPTAKAVEATAEHREETHAREKAESEDARDAIDEGVSTSKPS